MNILQICFQQKCGPNLIDLGKNKMPKIRLELYKISVQKGRKIKISCACPFLPPTRPFPSFPFGFIFGFRSWSEKKNTQKIYQQGRIYAMNPSFLYQVHLSIIVIFKKNLQWLKSLLFLHHVICPFEILFSSFFSKNITINMILAK